MPDKLIINARHTLSWRRRLLSDVATALLWAGWILLWLPVFGKLRQVIALHMSFAPAAIQVLDTLTPISLLPSIIALVGTSTLLLLWTLLPMRKLTHAHGEQTLDDYAEYFNLEGRDIVAGQDSRICVVSHDDHGNIVGIESRES
ncbi:MAG TPA: poly-beta-1,6-N-acetyl-D-glucosamine biosynthesis protein PgaD [Xanthomonadaceae bacterium]|jgi:poly-beta-1,6-N-acetyl-D-glucosamine biosynthesis protein PgaD|nr:poly-beta-1,6-N-acetyl-D-glucosamine biosynthesis protein PgaD [Xanthomonadaceae bacterium]